MRLINQTQNTILAENIFVADTVFKRAKGLLGKQKFLAGEALILEPCNSVHTFFMRFPIDLLFVDKNFRVIKALSGLAPNRITGIYWRASRAIELPCGTLKPTKTCAKDQLFLAPTS